MRKLALPIVCIVSVGLFALAPLAAGEDRDGSGSRDSGRKVSDDSSRSNLGDKQQRQNDGVRKHTPKPKVHPTGGPTPRATASPRPTAAPTATPRPTVAPTASPRPTLTPRPTATPRPTVAPTATPRPTAAPTASPRPTATPAPAVNCANCHSGKSGPLPAGHRPI